MAYLVRIMPRAERDLEAIFLYIQADSSLAARRWFSGLAEAIESLGQHPLRSPRAPEDASLRQTLYGNRPHIYRILYSVDTRARTVNIVLVRHHARDQFKSTGELE